MTNVIAMVVISILTNVNEEIDTNWREIRTEVIERTEVSFELGGKRQTVTSDKKIDYWFREYRKRTKVIETWIENTNIIGDASAAYRDRLLKEKQQKGDGK